METHRIFIYSSEQKKQKDEINKNVGYTYVPGVVIVSGQQKKYTDMVTSMDNCKYGDAIVVAKGDINKMTYTEPRRM